MEEVVVDGSASLGALVLELVDGPTLEHARGERGAFTSDAPIALALQLVECAGRGPRTIRW